MGIIKVAEYHSRALEELEFPDGSVWKLRQPLEADYYRYQEVAEEHRTRVRAKAAEITERAKALAEQSGGDDEARALIDAEADEDRLDVTLTTRYLQASLLSVFLAPEQKPETILEKLGPDIIQYLLYRVQEIISGDAAKKRVAGTS
jgi:hypothetical protein